MIEFDVIGKIKGKGRPRFFNNRAITPKDTVNYENLVKFSFINAKQKKIEGETPLIVEILCLYGIPNSYSKKRKQNCIKGLEMPTKKPDSDNIAKIILDSLNMIAYDDDKQVVMLLVRKLYTQDQEKVNVKIKKYIAYGKE